MFGHGRVSSWTCLGVGEFSHGLIITSPSFDVFGTRQLSMWASLGVGEFWRWPRFDVGEFDAWRVWS